MSPKLNVNKITIADAHVGNDKIIVHKLKARQTGIVSNIYYCMLNHINRNDYRFSKGI